MMIGTRPRFLRFVVAALLVFPAIVASVAPSLASPTKQDVENAKERLAQLQEQFAALNEQYNEALYQLQQAQAHLDEAQAMKAAAEQQAADARAQLAKRAVQAYTGMGSQYEALLSADSMSEFSDRLEFLGAMTQTDADLASRAEAAAQEAAWAGQEYNRAVADRQAKADALEAEKQAAQQSLNEQAQLASQLQSDYQSWYRQQQQALEAPPPADPPPSDPPSTDPTGFVPPPNATAAAIAVAAAESVIGAPYVFGAAGPDAFDCSGLTSWAWAQAGVSIPHSASAQYTSLPRVPLSDVVPGDIIYYGNFGPHVAIYVGGGQIVHARHPGPGGEVQYSSMYGYDTPWGAVRPG
jgi:cell wall-associated NlpC family hydrolase